jgi:type IV secretory pathway VirD2 relaxase
VTVKARVVRHTSRSAPLGAHLGYLRREGVTRDGEKARLFGRETEDADPKAFAERSQGDRHHFRFIVSPEDAPEMAGLKGFARELVGQMEKDLGTKLDWVAVDHWNTQHPHVHIIVRGVAEDGKDLVISRNYIKEGMRARTQDLVTQELGQGGLLLAKLQRSSTALATAIDEIIRSIESQSDRPKPRPQRNAAKR